MEHRMQLYRAGRRKASRLSAFSWRSLRGKGLAFFGGPTSIRLSVTLQQLLYSESLSTILIFHRSVFDGSCSYHLSLPTRFSSPLRLPGVVNWVPRCIFVRMAMLSPIQKATIQASCLSIISSTLAQLLQAYRKSSLPATPSLLNPLGLRYLPIFQFLFCALATTVRWVHMESFSLLRRAENSRGSTVRSSSCRLCSAHIHLLFKAALTGYDP